MAGGEGGGGVQVPCCFMLHQWWIRELCVANLGERNSVVTTIYQYNNQITPTTAIEGKPPNTTHLRSRLTRLRRESMSEIICITSWSCRRSSPLLKITCKEGAEKKTRGQGWRRTPDA